MQVSCALVSPSWRELIARTREFHPSWVSVSKAWTKVPSAERDSHFFATLEFENNHAVFQKVIRHLPMKGL